MSNAKEISSQILIQGRKMNFDLDMKSIKKDWFDDDPFKTTFLCALSVQFPEGERLFMDAVRDQLVNIQDETLKEQVKGFIKQEAMHGHEHVLLNDHLESIGYPVQKTYDRQYKERTLGRKLFPRYMLAITCATEHFTAIMANRLLTDPSFTEGMDETLKKLWVWHAVEEAEHKGVAYDVYQKTIGSYPMRALSMVHLTLDFIIKTAIIQASFLKRDKQLFKWSTLKSGLKFHFGKNGLLPALWKEYIEYYRFNFHPWNEDNRAIIDQWEREQAEYKII